MKSKETRTRLLRWVLLVAAVAAVAAVPAAGTPRDEGRALEAGLANRLSQGVAFRYWTKHPGEAPEPLRERLAAAAKISAKKNANGSDAVQSNLFNRDRLGLPQNEESVSACRANTNYVLGGTNDYRGLLDPEENFTGWHFSTNSGASVAKEGLLPPVEIEGNQVPSGGDPVDDIEGAGCDLYAASLNYDPVNFDTAPNGIGVYKSTPQTLLSPACRDGEGPSDPDCWPVRRAVATFNGVAVDGITHFLDKEWMDVGVSGAAGRVVWVTYSDFTVDPNAPLGFSGASIYAVRCDGDLVSCTDPILISGSDADVQFSDVTIGPDGRVYVTWSEIQGELEETDQTFIHKMRVAEPGSTTFGPTRVIYAETNAIPFGGALQANDFRIATYAKNDVAIVNGHPRVFVTWDACTVRLFGSICEFPRIKLSYSDDLGATWNGPNGISSGGPSYFPTISVDRTSQQVAVAWFTNRFDPAFWNRQDVELTTLNPVTVQPVRSQRLTTTSNESEADPLLGGFFIGDYIEVFAHGGRAWTHYNANYRQIQLLGLGLPVNQQDNFLARSGL